MQLIKDNLRKRHFEPSKKDSTWYHELSKEMTAYFKTNCYWIPYRFERHKIYEKFKVAQQEKRDFRYFLGMLQK
jgi:hypothetical protein